MPECFIRPMRLADIDAVARLEQEAFPTQAPGTSFARELRNPLASYLVACCRRDGDGNSDAHDGDIVGYAGLWFVLDEAHLTAIAVQEAHRRRGIGHRLLTAALELALEKGATLMTLEVRISNQEAQALYEKFGFARVGVRRGYYSDNHEDAYLMTVEHIESTEYRSKLETLRAEARSG
ncbi:MAG: ribosomal protein S18-alanine N-acetyltransferase [Chloroflexi bacterium]|nr:ribosomal protein S18-alanine N-acetyltransferase [Chloroflexota bacterium]